MLRVRELSIWELAHRWYDADPYKTRDPEDMSLEVKDLIRTLADEIYKERLISHLHREGESTIEFKKTQTVEGRISKYSTEFERCIKHNEYDFEFLNQVFVESQYLKCWCNDYDILFPEFWLSWLDDNQTAKMDIPGTKLGVNPNKGKSGHRKNQDMKSERHQKAARARHGPAADLKRDFISDWELKSEINPKLSRAQAVKNFVSDQGEDRVRKAGLKITNAENTLLRALRAYENGPEQTWMQSSD